MPYVSDLHASMSGKNNGGGICASVYLLFVRYLMRGLTVQIAMFPPGQEAQEGLLENFELITHTSDMENFYCGTSSLPR